MNFDEVMQELRRLKFEVIPEIEMKLMGAKEKAPLLDAFIERLKASAVNIERDYNGRAFYKVSEELMRAVKEEVIKNEDVY